jgi:hypothetical protein
MSYTLDTGNVKYLHDHAAALEHHDSIKPIKNVTPECRPIAERRKTHFNIRKHGEDIVVRLYDTDIIIYHQNNTITLNMGGWNRRSTRAAILAAAGVNISNSLGRAWVRDHDAKWYPFENGMQLQTGDHYGYSRKIIDPVHPTVHTLNRKALNQKLRQFRDYYNYMLGVTKVDGWRGVGPDILFGDLSAVANPDNYRDGVFAPEPEAAFALGARMLANYDLTVRHHWRFFVGTGNTNPLTGMNIEHIIRNALKRMIIKTHKDELLTKTTVTDGRAVRDKYEWAL